jgi:hypothetical protein
MAASMWMTTGFRLEQRVNGGGKGLVSMENAESMPAILSVM